MVLGICKTIGKVTSVILEIYDEIKRAKETGEAYRTRLEPPPADATVAHEGRMGVEV
jgi:hypothetical protein